jgi:hypothetical protein
VVGPSAVLEYDANNPESKPDWLEAKCQEPITAILMWIEKLVAEIYRATNAGGLNATETSKDAKSGVALKQEFQLLNAKLAAKADLLDQSEIAIIGHWLRWQERYELSSKISVSRPRNFDIEDLVTDLSTAMTAKTVINSSLFQAALQKSLARQMLPGLKSDAWDAIDKEIDKVSSEPPAAPVGANIGG